MGPGSGRRVADVEDDGGRCLHERLLRGDDPTAPSDLLCAYLSPLVARLCREFPRVDETVLHDVAMDLLIDLGMRPQRYDPTRSALSTYLRMAARRDVLNALDHEQRRSRRTAPLDDVELRPSAWNSLWTRSSDPAATMLDADGDARVAALLDHFAGCEREVVTLIVEGERDTGRYATLLGIQDRPWDEQRREVKRVKDRLKGRLKRLWKRRYGDE